MKFTSAALVEQVLWDMRLADLPRGINRALIDRLFNGLPPWTEAEARENRINTNVNWLEGPRLAADARRSYSNAFLKPGNFFNVTLDHGPVHKRERWGKIITREWNKAMKQSRSYFEFLRSQFALTVLHGIGPGFWCDRDHWVPRCLGVEDVMIPSNTLLGLENLSYFGIFRQYTAMELYMMTHGPNVDPAWNMPVVEAALKWADQQTQAELSYSELYAPQKVEDRWKQDLGFYATDAVPTIDCWDFYFWSDDGDIEGWRRRIVLDTPTSGEVRRGDRGSHTKLPPRNLINSKHGDWLYCPTDKRIYAEKIDQIIHFQFGDATATAPFRYHSVRSLGWLSYAVCHLQNRLRCKINDAVFEALLQYFRTANPDDREALTKVDLHDLGVIPAGLSFVRPEERWKIDPQTIELGLTQNAQMLTESAAQYREGRNQGPTTKEKTATEIMAEVNSANALIGAMLLQAYIYHSFQGREIARRFCVPNSQDSDVRGFRNNVLKAGVPEDVLDSSTWNIEPERVLGNGNKTLEVAMADKLMAARQLHDPESQREILYLYDMANSDNPDLAQRLVPLDKARVSDSVHDAQLALGTLMLGIPMKPVKGQNPIEVIETLMGGAAVILKRITQQGGKTDPEELAGLQNVLQTTGQYIQLLAQDKAEKARVKQYGEELTKLGALLKALAKAGAKQQGQPGTGQPDPKDVAKAQAITMLAQTKAQSAAQSHAQRTQQRDVQFRMEQQRKAEAHLAEQKERMQELKVKTAAEDLKTAAEIKRTRLKKLRED